MMMKLAYIPSLLVGLRLAIAPFLLVDAWDRQISDWFLVGYVIAVLSDIFDGINSLEEIAMTLILPEWECDILSIFAAIDLRKSSILVLQEQEK